MLRWSVALAVAFALGAWAAAVVVEPRAAAPAGPEQLWFMVVDDTVSRQVSVGVRGEWVPAGAIASPASGVLTEQLVADGTPVQDGTVIGTVDLEPIVAATGAIPAFRPLDLGVAGRDVDQLQALLRRSGHLRGSVHAGTFDDATAAAVRRWERELGLPESGMVPVGRVVYVASLPVPIRWTAAVGDVLSPGQPLAEVLHPEPRFTALLTPDQARELEAGTVVTITSPSGAHWSTRLGSGVAAGEAVEVDLHGSCAPGCGELPVPGQTRLRGAVTVVPPTTGPVVPVSAVRLDDRGRRYVVVRGRGRARVDVLATASGMSVVDGVAVGDEVALPVEPGGGG